MKSHKHFFGTCFALVAILLGLLVAPTVAGAVSEPEIEVPEVVQFCAPTSPCNGDDLTEAPMPNLLCYPPVLGPCNGDPHFEFDGRIKIRNRSHQDETMTVLVVIRDPERKRIFREKLTIEIPARTTIRVHPNWFINDYDPDNIAGKHRYVVREVRDDGTIGKRIKRGAFNLDPILSPS